MRPCNLTAEQKLILEYTGSSSGLQLLYLAEPKAYLAEPTLPVYFKSLRLIGSTMPVYIRADSRCTSPGQQLLFFTQFMMPVHRPLNDASSLSDLRSLYLARPMVVVLRRVYFWCSLSGLRCLFILGSGLWLLFLMGSTIPAPRRVYGRCSSSGLRTLYHVGSTDAVPHGAYYCCSSSGLQSLFLICSTFSVPCWV